MPVNRRQSANSQKRAAGGAGQDRKERFTLHLYFDFQNDAYADLQFQQVNFLFLGSQLVGSFLAFHRRQEYEWEAFGRALAGFPHLSKCQQTRLTYLAAGSQSRCYLSQH